MTAKIGIYMITNTIDNKRYIGKSIDLKRRLRKHKYYLANETHHNIHLQRAYNKYGLEYFKFDILEYCTEKELDYLEMFYIEKYDSFHNGYNMNMGGETGRGYKHEEEFKIKQSENNKGKLNPKAKQVICEGKIFDTIRECAKYYKVSENAMYKWLSGYRNMRQEFIDKGLKFLE